MFEEHINARIVHRQLRHCFEYLDSAEISRLTQVVCGSRPLKRIFVLLALVDKLSDIRYFIEQNVTDSDLPLQKVAPPGSNIFTLGFDHSSGDHIEPIACLDRWNPATIRMLEEWQWSTLAPTFQRGETKDIKHISLPDDMPLPFMADSQYDTGSAPVHGGYSTVFKVVIHPAHHSFHDSEVGPKAFLFLFFSFLLLE